MKKLVTVWLAACAVAAICGGLDQVGDAHFRWETGGIRGVLDGAVMVIVALAVVAAATYSGTLAPRVPFFLAMITTCFGWCAAFFTLTLCAHDIDGALGLVSLVVVAPLACIAGWLATRKHSDLARRP